MELNWIIIAIVLVLSIALIIFLIIRNVKDKREYEKLLNSDTDIVNNIPPVKDVEENEEE